MDTRRTHQARRALSSRRALSARYRVGYEVFHTSSLPSPTIYLITQHRGLAERQVQQAREDMRHFIGYSIADELDKLERLKNSGTISNEEYTRLRAQEPCNSRRYQNQTLGP